MLHPEMEEIKTNESIHYSINNKGVMIYSGL